MDIHQELSLRPLSENEIALLPPGSRPGDHRVRFYLQREGHAVFLIAWLGSLAVGQLLLTWAGEAREPMVSHLTRCPSLTDFAVLPEYRSQGIGSIMLDHIERHVQEQGYQQIGLGVSANNPRARALYERRGYQDSGVGEYLDAWTWMDEQGQEFLVVDRCHYLVKPLQAKPR